MGRLAGLSFGFVLLAPSARAQCLPEQVVQLVPPVGSPGDLFGSSIDLDGDTLVVGAPRDDDNGFRAGSAYVFVRDPGEPGSWRRVAKLLAADGAPRDECGTAVAVSGDHVVVGAFLDDDNGEASGSAYVFRRDRGGPEAWGQVAKLVAPGGTEDDLFGAAVSLDRDTLLVGAYFAEVGGLETGLAYVFERNAGGPDAWGFTARLAASDPDLGDRFGASVSVCRDSAVIGAVTDSELGAAAGAAYVFERSATTGDSWMQSSKLLAADGSAFDQCGIAAISGHVVLVGAGTDDHNGSNAGSAYVFERDPGGGDSWTQKTKILPQDPDPHDQFGSFVALDSNSALIGAIFDQDNGASSGSAYLFRRDMGGPGSWGQVAKLLPSDGAPGDGFGRVAVSGRRLAVGASKGVLPGAAYLFDDLLPYPPVAYCTRQPTSTAGCVPSIRADGVASATASSGLVLGADPLPGQSVGVYLYSHEGSAAALAVRFGTLCIRSGPLFAVGPFPVGGTAGRCDGALWFDWNAFVQSDPTADPANTQVGTTVDGQLWCRDPESPAGALLTDAVSFTVCR